MIKLQNPQDKNYKPVKNIVPYEQIIKNSRKTLKDLETLCNNYDEKHTRMGCGRNGFGAKLTNIFSKQFIVEVEDPDTKTKFKGIWRDNMFKDDENGKPEIEIQKDRTKMPPKL